MDWEIANLSRVCTACEHAFAEEEDLFSAIRDEKTTFVRFDFCRACWDQQDRDVFFSHWQTRCPKRDVTPKRFVDDDVILNFFYRLEGETEDLKIHFRYVLGLLLLRKKLLKFKNMRRDGEDEWLLLYDRREDRDHEVYDPKLTGEEVAAVTEECGKILNVKL